MSPDQHRTVNTRKGICEGKIQFHIEKDITTFLILHLKGTCKLSRPALDGKTISARINLPKNRLWILVFVKVNRTATMFFCDFFIIFLCGTEVG